MKLRNNKTYTYQDKFTKKKDQFEEIANLYTLIVGISVIIILFS